jgi:Pyruvate/2-oxoacid:ferredoxin oxidoreductase delta subunit
MKAKRKIIEIDEEHCSGCGECVSACAEGAIQLVEGKARLVSENYCDGLAACLGECPEGALRIVEREAESFDPEAVERHLQRERTTDTGISTTFHSEPQTSPVPERSCPGNSEPPSTLPCSPSSTDPQIFGSPCQSANRPVSLEATSSALTHWPVQIRLVPPTASFLRGADLLVVSDCAPVAYPAFHTDFLKGRVALMGCPKFDDTEEYIKKFADIFRIAGIRSITILIMEVPCCSRMPAVVRQGLALAGKDIAVEVVVIGAQGKVLRRERPAP